MIGGWHTNSILFLFWIFSNEWGFGVRPSHTGDLIKKVIWICGMWNYTHQVFDKMSLLSLGNGFSEVEVVLFRMFCFWSWVPNSDWLGYAFHSVRLFCSLWSLFMRLLFSELIYSFLISMVITQLLIMSFSIRILLRLLIHVYFLFWMVNKNFILPKKLQWNRERWSQIWSTCPSKSNP